MPKRRRDASPTRPRPKKRRPAQPDAADPAAHSFIRAPDPEDFGWSLRNLFDEDAAKRRARVGDSYAVRMSRRKRGLPPEPTPAAVREARDDVPARASVSRGYTKVLEPFHEEAEQVDNVAGVRRWLREVVGAFLVNAQARDERIGVTVTAGFQAEAVRSGEVFDSSALLAQHQGITTRAQARALASRLASVFEEKMERELRGVSDARFATLLRVTVHVGRLPAHLGGAWVPKPAFLPANSVINFQPPHKEADTRCLYYCLLFERHARQGRGYRVPGLLLREQAWRAAHGGKPSVVMADDDVDLTEGPVSIAQLALIEEWNPWLRIAAYGIDHDDDGEPRVVCLRQAQADDDQQLVRVLLVRGGPDGARGDGPDDIGHYMLITKPTSLLRRGEHAILMCPYCLFQVDHRARAWFNEHVAHGCRLTAVVPPAPGDTVTFFGTHRMRALQRVPHCVFADVAVERVDGEEVPSGFAMVTTDNENAKSDLHCVSRAALDCEAPVEELVHALRELAPAFHRSLTLNVKMIMTDEDWRTYRRATHCAHCRCEFAPKPPGMAKFRKLEWDEAAGAVDAAVQSEDPAMRAFMAKGKRRHHNHKTGAFIAPLCATCNLHETVDSNTPVPVFVHGLCAKNKAIHILNALDGCMDEGEHVSPLAFNSERFRALSLRIPVSYAAHDGTRVQGSVRYSFLDTEEHLKGSVEDLARPLTPGQRNVSARVAGPDAPQLLKDVCLVADAITAYARTMFDRHGLDPLVFMTAATFAWHGLLKAMQQAGHALHLCADAKVNAMFAQMRIGGLCTIGSRRIVECNHPSLPGYDASKPLVQMAVLDANSMYPSVWQNMADGDFRMEPTPTLAQLPAILESDWEHGERGGMISGHGFWPKRVHARFREFVPLAERCTVPDEWLSEPQRAARAERPGLADRETLVMHLHGRDFTVTLERLAHAVALGFVVNRVDAMVTWHQSPWAMPWLSSAVAGRVQARATGDKVLEAACKLCLNAPFGQTMLQKENFRTTRVVRAEDDAGHERARANPLYAGSWIRTAGDTTYYSMMKQRVKNDAPAFVGCIILDRAKLALERFWFTLQARFGAALRFISTDTDSLHVAVEGLVEPLHAVLATDPAIRPHLDLSNMPAPWHDAAHAAQLGRWKLEYPPADASPQPAGIIARAAYVARKVYCIDVVGRDARVKAKGVPSAVAEERFGFDRMVACIRGQDMREDFAATRARGMAVRTAPTHTTVRGEWDLYRWSDDGVTSVPFGFAPTR